MKKYSNETKKHFSTYIILGIVILISLFYIMYISFNVQDNMKNNTIIEKNNLVSIYEETKPITFELATYTTTIYDQDKNRIHNITLACKKLNGFTLSPNQEFSFNDTLGTMDKQDGYKKALGFDSNGNKIKMYGGGICQISSTLYNAALIANLEITERHAHSRRVNYVPKGKDATVYYGGPNLKFINTTSNPIIIYANTDGNMVTITLKSHIKEISKPLM